MINGVITFLNDFVNNLSKDDIYKIPDENVLDMNQQMNAVRERLAEVKALPPDTPVHVVIWLIWCSVPKFDGPFELMTNNDYINYMKCDVATVNNKRNLVRVKILLSWF